MLSKSTKIDHKIAPTYKTTKNENEPVSNFGDWCRMTGWHGILDLHLSGNLFLKLTWAAVIILCAFLAVNQCVSLILDFTSDDQWVTSVTYEMPEDGLDWPNITVYNLDWKSKTKIKDMGLIDLPYMVAYVREPEDVSLLFYDQYQADEPQLHDQSDVDNMRENIQNMSRQFLKSYSITDVLKGRPCNETAIHCGWSNDFDLRNPAVNCCHQGTAYENYFTIYSTTAFGKSYRNTGYDSAVYFLFDPQITDYYPHTLRLDKPSAGLHLELFFGDEDSALRSTILLAPGMHTLVSLVREKHKTTGRRLKTINLYEVKKPCISKYKYEYIDHDAYSSTLCVKDCLAQWSMSACQCNVFRTAFDSKKASKCVGASILTCFQQWGNTSKNLGTQNTTDNSDKSVDLVKCFGQCKEACEYDTIDAKVSTAMFPAPVKVQAFTTYLNRAFASVGLNFSEEKTRQLSLFEMYFEMKEHRVIEKVTRTSLDELISNFGGALGVWTGVSILSIWQCVVYAVKGIFSGNRNARRNPSVNQILY